MKVEKLEVLGIVVPNLDEAIKLFSEIFETEFVNYGELKGEDTKPGEIGRQIELTENIENRETLMARFIGLLLTDGGVSQISGKKWKVHFTANSETLCNNFITLIKKLFNLSTRPVKSRGAFSINVWISEKTKNELLSYSPNYRKLAYDKLNGKYPKTIIPEFISNNSKLAREFLKYAFTGDGSVIFNIGRARYGFRFDRCVKMYCEHPNLRKQYFELLKKLGYKPVIWKDSIILRKPENLTKFQREINFVENVKISGNGLWKGFNKTDLLKFCVKSYGLEPSKLGKTKEEIHTNLKYLLLKQETR